MKIAKLLGLPVVAGLLFASCKKELKKDPPPPTGDTTTASRSDLLKDSVYLYTKEVYLWHSVIPPYAQFNPRGYTSGSTDLESAENTLNAITKLQPLDRYSFVTSIEKSDGLQTGADKDFGFTVQAASLDRVTPYDSVYWFVPYVYQKSAAGLAGVQRGWYVSKINGTTLRYDQSSVDLLNSTFYGSTTSANFEFTKPDGTTTSASLNASSYVANSILYKTVYSATSGSTKVGYLVFNQFFGQPSIDTLTQVLGEFSSSGITDLVVDLRYNHGGSTNTQDALANLIAPATASGKKMYTYVFNDSLQAGKFPLLRKNRDFIQFSSGSFTQTNNTVSFQKAGNLNLTRVFFIVSNQTASASELLINNLRPYMDVKLVGDTTYGKPVGFFGINLYSYNLALYPISFKTVNSVGSADYYSGFAPDKLTPDGVNRSWGDTNEPSLATVLNYISTGSFGRSSNVSDLENRRLLNIQKQYQPGNKKLYDNELRHSGLFIKLR